MNLRGTIVYSHEGFNQHSWNRFPQYTIIRMHWYKNLMARDKTQFLAFVRERYFK